MSTPAVNIMPCSAANLTLRLGRPMEEESTGAMASLPLGFGRNIEGSILRPVPNLPQSSVRTAAKSVTKTQSDVLREPMHSPSANELLYSTTFQP